MTRCEREPEVVDAVLGRHLSTDTELDMHIGECDVCRDVVAIATALHDDREWIRSDAPIPAAGQVWWRAAVRARLEGTQAAARPLTLAHGVAAASAAGLAVGAAGMAWPTIERIAAWFGDRVASVNPPAMDVTALVAAALQRSLPLALAVAACLLLAPLALYFALSDE